MPKNNFNLICTNAACRPESVAAAARHAAAAEVLPFCPITAAYSVLQY